VCWNARAGQCEDCAPDENEELASAKAQATREQIAEKARAQDYTTDLDFGKNAIAACSSCGAKLAAGAKFCAECGTPAAQAKPKFCSSCGTKLEPGAKFCPECGGKA
jgi:uncharacterized OB-fold protein